MKEYDKITTIEQFWNKFKNEVFVEVDEYQSELIHALFFTACAGMYAIMKLNIFEKDDPIRVKMDFMKSLEKEIHEFGQKINNEPKVTVKH